MKQHNTLLNKIILLIILSIAAGMLSFLPQANSKQKELSKNSLKIQENDQKDTINCINPANSEISTLTEAQKNKIAPQECLYLGCNGFNF